MTVKNTKIKVPGMHCTSCEKIIKKAVSNIEGVREIKIDYATESGEVTYDPSKTDIGIILDTIESKGYECSIFENSDEEDHYTFNKNVIGWVLGIFGVLITGYFLFSFVEGISVPEISPEMSLGLLFLVGLLTGFHCVSMCGGFVVSYTAKDAEARRKPYKSHFMYGLGKLVSYTVIGATFGLLGSIITFTPIMRGVAGIIAGLFLVIFGLNMLNIFPFLRRFSIKMPSFISNFVGKKSTESKSPLIIGLLNGLMIACGPLQAIYIMAAGTGSWIEGAKLLFVFALGTLPVMIGFGFFTSFISKKATHKILKASGAIVIILGLIMVNRGLALTGIGLDTNSLSSTFTSSDSVSLESMINMEDGFQVIEMDVTRYGWEPDKFVLKKGIPVKWKINGKEITGCNNAINVPKYDLEFDIKQGEQIIEFTPGEEGIVSWSCWMGMIPGTFIVKGDMSDNPNEIEKELASVPQKTAGSCGGSCGSNCGGSCGCGGR